MEPIVNYLEDTEKKLVKEMSELFTKMREQRDTMSLQGIEDMYTYKPVEGVLYEPCVRIPCTNPNVKRYSSTLYYCSHYKLPQDEFIIFIKESADQSEQMSSGTKYCCIALTNYGRFIGTFAIVQNRQFGGFNSYGPAANNNEIYDASHGQTPSGKNPIIKLDPLPYKLPTHFFKIFLLAFKIIDNQTVSDTTTSLQELNKEFYLFAGKWQPHMTVYATIEVDTMRQTILENTENIQEISEKNKILEEKNRNLQAELEKLKEQNAALEKEKTKLLPLEKYKEAVLEFMDNHYIGNEPWDHDDTSDKDIIEYFSNWHNDKVFMEQYEYDDFMNQQEELNEYRIYKKVKGRK